MKKEKILIGVVCLVLTLAITLQLRTMSKTDSTVTKTFANDDLKDKLLQWEERYEAMTKALEKSNKELEEIRTASSQNDTTSKENTEKIKKNNMLLGLTDVIGDGIIITAKDGQIPSTIATDNISLYLVHDSDLIEIVSELKNAGAEAISINDQRIVSTTAITCAGNVISINGQKVGSPFIIKAIGNPEMLYGIKRPGGYIHNMEEYTSIKVEKSTNIQIKKFNGAISSKHLLKED